MAAGDRVLFRPSGDSQGIIERIEARHGVLCRTSRRKATHSGNECRSAADHWQRVPSRTLNQPGGSLSGDGSVEPFATADLHQQSRLGECRRLAAAGWALFANGLPGDAAFGPHRDKASIDCARQLAGGGERGRPGKAGVGKSSLLNAVDPKLDLRVRAVNSDTQKGRHTTTTARLIPLQSGGYVVDTPGIRQFQLWDIVPAEVGGCFRDLRPYISRCRFPNCTHTHEAACAVKDAVADGRIDARRYESYCNLFLGEAD